MSRFLIGPLFAVVLLVACAPSTLSQRDMVGGVFLVGYQAGAGALAEALVSRGPSVQPGDAYGFLNLTSRSGNTVVLSARLLGGVGQLGNDVLAAEIWIQASIEQDGQLAIVTFRGEPVLSGAVADARRGLVGILDAQFDRGDLPPTDGGTP
jgi:hypothetical protein